jgi:hypothetical protein
LIQYQEIEFKIVKYKHEDIIILIKKKLALPIISLSVILLCFFYVVTINSSNSLNPFKVSSKVTEPYFFLAVGHSYGGQKPRNTTPANILINNVELFNQIKPEFLIHLGDIYQKPILEDIDAIDSFNNNLSFPVFNAIGNHEYGTGKNYEIENYKKDFSDTFFSFSIGNSLFLVVDSQQYRKYSMEAEQHKFVISEINKFKYSEQLKNLFILSHHLIWAASSEYFSEVIKLSNAPYHHSGKFSEWKSIIDSFDELTADKNVFFLSGDVGLKSSIPYFYEEDPRGNRTYLATGVGDTEDDSILIGAIDSDNKVSFHPLKLGDKNIKHYGLNYWSKIHPRLAL